MSSISNLLGNLGQADLASNFILEQKTLGRVLASENRTIRDIIDEKVSKTFFNLQIGMLILFHCLDGGKRGVLKNEGKAGGD